MNIGEKIKTLRKEKKITQKQLAEMINKNIRTIQKYESCEIKIPLESLVDISRTLNVPLKYFNCIDEVPTLELGSGVKAFGIGEKISFLDMISSLKDPFLGRSKEEIINMCEYASKILEASNLKITCVKDKEFDYLIHIMNYNTGKNIYMQYDQFFVEAEKITWFMKNEISTIMEGDTLE